MSVEQFKRVCLLKLESLPSNWMHADKTLKVCPLAVARLKHIRAAVATKGKELSEAEEARLPGCPYAIRNQMCGYCFFIYEATLLNDTPPTDTEIAYMLDISVDCVRSTFETALAKSKSSDFVKELKEAMQGEVIVDESFSLDDEYAYCE